MIWGLFFGGIFVITLWASIIGAWVVTGWWRSYWEIQWSRELAREIIHVWQAEHCATCSRLLPEPGITPAYCHACQHGYRSTPQARQGWTVVKAGGDS